MVATVTLSDELFARAQKLAIPLVDTLESVIARGFDALEAAGNGRAAANPVPTALAEGELPVTRFNPGAPPNLAFTQPISVRLCGSRLLPGQLYWNTLMLAAIRQAATILDREALMDLMVVPSLVGRKQSQGYRYLKEIGISVQGQDANGAWKQTYHIANALRMPVEVVWRWQNTEKAALPGQKGSFTAGHSSLRVGEPVA